MAERRSTPTRFGGDEEERLAAARDLRVNPTPDAIPDLQAALARERVRWVQIALREALAECQGLSSGVSPDEPTREEAEQGADSAQAYADGHRDGLRQALHELAPLIGLARAAAEATLDQDSEVRNQLERMRTVATALRRLVSAAAAPQMREFDLAAQLSALAKSPPVESPPGLVGASGPSPFVIRGDPELLELAVQPLLTNAIEASLSVGGDPAPSAVVISWGAEQTSSWIAVIDRGPGPPKVDQLFDLGATDKPGHFGFGLETARTAVESLGGTVELEQNSRGGATAILRWPRPD